MRSGAQLVRIGGGPGRPPEAAFFSLSINVSTAASVTKVVRPQESIGKGD
jgi:hypothetical protein